MDNQKDQFGSTPDQPNASRNTTANNPAPAPNVSGASAASHESVPAPGDAAPASNAPSQSTSPTTNAQLGTLVDTALNSGRKWMEDSSVLNNVNQLPQSLKDLGNRAVDRINGLSTTQKVVGSAILAAGLGWLATRKGKSSSSDSSDSRSYNYGRQRDAGSYGRESYGYQAPDASTSRHSDSGSAYGNSGSRFGSSDSYNTEVSSASNTDIHSNSGRDDSGASYGNTSARTDHGIQSASTDYRAKSTDYRSIE